MNLHKAFCSFFKLFILISTLITVNLAQEYNIDENFVCTSESHRPRYHFSSKENWINDPNGMIFYNGVYHLYFQYNPNNTVPGLMHWGHAISSNMLIWEEVGVALEADELGAIFSGSAVVDTTDTAGFKNPNSSIYPIIAIYTNAGGEDYKVQSQSIAYSLDNGFTFTKYDKNPVLKSNETEDFRDPKIIYHAGRWVMSLAVKDRIEFYSSKNLKEWVKESEVGRSPSIGNKEGVWECPDLLPLTVEISEKQEIEVWALLVSINPGGPNGGSATQYFIGNFTNNFTSSDHLEYQPYSWSKNQWLDWGPDNYAGVTFSNQPRGRHIYMAWMSNWAYAEHTPQKTHRGQMTLPRELSIRVLNQTAQQYRLISTPIPELASLRHPHQYFIHDEPFNVLPQTLPIELLRLDAFDTPLLELEIAVEFINNPNFAICAHNDLEEEVCFGNNGTHWYLDRSNAGNTQFDENYLNIVQAYAAREISTTSSNIRIFIDVTSIEVFADDGLTTMTALHFPTKPFTMFHVKNLERPDSVSDVVVHNYKIWGLRCWFPDVGAESENEDGKGSGSIFHVSIVSLILCVKSILLILS